MLDLKVQDVIIYVLDFNNKVCLQWGYFSGGNGNTTKTIKFPTSFNSSCRGIAFAPYDTHTTWYPAYGTTFMIQSISKTQFICRKNGDTYAVAQYWIATGY